MEENDSRFDIFNAISVCLYKQRNFENLNEENAHGTWEFKNDKEESNIFAGQMWDWDGLTVKSIFTS